MTSPRRPGGEPKPAPASFVPVHPRDRGMHRNPESAAAHAAALRAVLQHLVVDTFDLAEEETLWVGFRLDQILAPLLDLKPHIVPFAVRQEMLDGSYTRLLTLRSKAHLVRGQAATPGRVVSVPLATWADAVMNPIVRSYSLRPMVEAEMAAQVQVMLRDLGVGDPTNPRAATHLPSDVRERIFADRSAQARTAAPQR